MMAQSKIIETNTEAQTIKAAQAFASSLKAGDIVFLHGDLGMGKSVFARAIVRMLCGDEDMEVPSPTYTIVQAYDANAATIWHFDLYRLSDPSEIYEIGWEEALDQGILLIEWPERLGDLAPDQAIHVNITSPRNAPERRTIEIVPYE